MPKLPPPPMPRVAAAHVYLPGAIDALNRATEAWNLAYLDAALTTAEDFIRNARAAMKVEAAANAVPSTGEPSGNMVDRGTIVSYAVDRWLEQVKNRPLVNIHRRTLDDTWRLVIRDYGGDPNNLIGPSHDDLLAGGAA
ncbi:hypothetical protein BH10PSE18_BH10PSE18_18660 [soil metagenome]